jgi:hypothetical protein
MFVVCFACGFFTVIICSFWNAVMESVKEGSWCPELIQIGWFLSFHALFMFVFVQCEICVSLSMWFSVYPRFSVDREQTISWHLGFSGWS